MMRSGHMIGNILRLLAALLAVTFAVAAMTFLPGTFGYASAADGDVVGGNYFLSDYDTPEEVVEAGHVLSLDTIAEGTVLLKNEDNALPFGSEGKKISVFGKNLYKYMGDFNSALRNEGFELNPSLSAFYNNKDLTGDGAPGFPGNGVVVNGMPTGEADISRFTDTESLKEYGDAAIVAFYRTSGEGWDLPRTMGMVDGDYKKFGENVVPVEGARAVDDHSLQLDANEAKLLEFCSDNFDKVIVIINTPAPIELGFLDDPDHYAYHENIKAALWTNTFRYESWPSLARILTGEVNPSGHLPDTFARDFKADPSWNNFGGNFMEDYIDESGKLVHAKGNQYANDEMYFNDPNANGAGGYVSNYVYYKEGIYSGYRYWETRGFTEGLDETWTGEPTDTRARYAHGPDEAIHYYSKQTADAAKQTELDGKVWDNWYDAHVVYPLGYGLSYTDFAWEWADGVPGGTLEKDGSVTVRVKVTNTGEYPGKDVVQLYYNAPYTGGIEKAHVLLGAFEKTELLDPGESQTLTLSFDVRDMASYDWKDANGNGFKGYELEKGTYNIYVGENAHAWADPDVMTAAYTLGENVRYETDDVTGNRVENRFDKMSEQLLREDRYPEDEDNDEKDKYMSRSDWTGTWPTLSYRLTAEQWIIDGVEEYNNATGTQLGTVYPEDKPGDPWYSDTMPTMGAKYETPIMLNELYGVAYDDTKWDEFLDQLTYEQLRDIAMLGSYSSGMDIPELGITKEHNQDHPTGVNLPGNPPLNVYLSNDIMTAASWNRDIAYRKGNILANISMWGGGNVEARVPGWYAPAVNVHRNPFGGRVGEYFSEDGILTGILAAEIVKGAQEKGMFCYVKHFAVNSQETNRCGLITWADEQTMREVYFKPFEICVKEGKTLGMMSSLNRFGPRWAGGCYELLTEVLRDEWGFRGCVVTDSFGPWSNADVMIRAGGSLALGVGTLHVEPDSATTVNCLRNATHDVLYAHANSFAINTGDTPTIPKRMSSFASKSLTAGMVGVEYSDTVADCLTLNTDYYPDISLGDITFSLASNGMLPDGLTMSPDGTISGKPKSASRMTFTVEAVYASGQTTEKISQSFTINIVGEGGAIIYEADDTHFDTHIGVPFTGSVATARIFDPFAEEGTEYPAISYSLANGSRLPEGISLSGDGTLSGTPTKECRDYGFTVMASAMGYGEVTLDFTISSLNKVTYTSGDLANGSYGRSYLAAVNTATGDPNVSYSLKTAGSLPAGLTLTPGGYIVGVPEEACTKTFTVIASAPYSETVEATYTLSIDPAFDSYTSLPYGKTGTSYMGSVATAQGSFDLTYSLVGGKLPKGLALGSDGTITGTPEEGGTFTITVRAQDGGLFDEIELALYIESSPVPENDNTGLIVGVTLGSAGAAAVIAAVVVGIVVYRRRKNNK